MQRLDLMADKAFWICFSGYALECQNLSTEQGCSLIEHVGVVQQCTAYAIGGR